MKVRKERRMVVIEQMGEGVSSEGMESEECWGRRKERARRAWGVRENIERNCEAKEKAEGQDAEHTKETERKKTVMGTRNIMCLGKISQV